MKVEKLSHAELVDLILLLAAKIEVLEERINQNSQNLSKPRSSDIKKAKRESIRRASGRKQGAQEGHKGAGRAVFPIEEVTEVVKCELPAECECGGKYEEAPGYKRHQVVDIPAKIPLEIVEYQRQKCRCVKCGTATFAPLPEKAPRSCFGPRVVSLMSILATRHRMSRRSVRDFVKSVLKIPISLGTVSNQEALVSRSISTEYDKYVAEILPASVKNIDETPYKQEGRGGYAWVLVSNAMTVLFYLRQSRGSKVAKEILGTNSPSYSTSDRYSAYSWIDPEKRQICFAHLLRDFTKIGERKGKAGKFGTLLVESTKELFHKWHKWKEAPEPKNKVQLNLDCKTLKERIKDTLYKGTYCGHLTTERTCKKILEVKESLWNFLEVDDLEPTNNAAERALRPLVIHRKLSFGTRSHRGTLFIERMFSILRTCKVRNINPLQLVSQKVHQNFATQT